MRFFKFNNLILKSKFFDIKNRLLYKIYKKQFFRNPIQAHVPLNYSNRLVAFFGYKTKLPCSKSIF